jgi:hypothetical protein
MMPRIAILQSLLGLCALAASAGAAPQEKGPPDLPGVVHIREDRFAGTVRSVHPLKLEELTDQIVLPVDIQIDFTLTVRIDRWQGEPGPYPAGKTLFFLLHSPAKRFGHLPEAWSGGKLAVVGKKFLFILTSTQKPNGNMVYELGIERPPAGGKTAGEPKTYKSSESARGGRPSIRPECTR